jgi:hypothetical protein
MVSTTVTKVNDTSPKVYKTPLIANNLYIYAVRKIIHQNLIPYL